MIEPTDKRPIEFVIFIIVLISGVPESIYGVVSGENDFPLLTIFFNVLFIAEAIGLWLRKEIARRILIEIFALMLLPVGLLMFWALGGVDKGFIEISSALGSVGLVVILIITVFYLRSDRLLKYYWANKIRVQST